MTGVSLKTGILHSSHEIEREEETTLSGELFRDPPRWAAHRWLSSVLFSVTVSMVLTGCYWCSESVYRLSETKMPLALKELVAQQPEYFTAPHTFVIAVDGSP